ncbi:MAG: hypothetical protein ACXVY5_07275 [Gaiellales bacterium]
MQRFGLRFVMPIAWGVALVLSVLAWIAVIFAIVTAWRAFM